MAIKCCFLLFIGLASNLWAEAQNNREKDISYQPEGGLLSLRFHEGLLHLKLNTPLQDWLPCDAPEILPKSSPLLDALVLKDKVQEVLKFSQFSSYELAKPEFLVYLSQEGNLLADLNLKENLLLPLRISGLALEPRELSSLCEDLGIAGLLDRLPHRCSGGERQKASLARALLHPAPIILADEPTSHLPPSERKRCLQLAIKKIEEKNRTLVMVTHNHEALELFPQTIEAPFLNQKQPS